MAAERMNAFNPSQDGEFNGERLQMQTPSEMPPPYSLNQQPFSFGLQDQPIQEMVLPQGTSVIVNSSGPLQMLLNCPVGPDPIAGVCPGCRQTIVTHLEYELGNHAQTMMCLFCILGGLLCVWIPCCVPSMQDVIHCCPNCKTVIGRLDR